MKHVIYFQNEQKKYRADKQLRDHIRACIAAALAYEDFDHKAEVSVTFVDNQGIREINREQRQIDRVTDVLSFPLSEGDELEINEDNGAALLGDIVLSLERAEEQAAEYGHSFAREVGFLTVHSVLHLLGYDHMTEDEEKEMRAHQRAILDGMGLTRQAT